MRVALSGPLGASSPAPPSFSTSCRIWFKFCTGEVAEEVEGPASPFLCSCCSSCSTLLPSGLGEKGRPAVRPTAPCAWPPAGEDSRRRRRSAGLGAGFSGGAACESRGFSPAAGIVGGFRTGGCIVRTGLLDNEGSSSSPAPLPFPPTPSPPPSTGLTETDDSVEVATANVRLVDEETTRPFPNTAADATFCLVVLPTRNNNKFSLPSPQQKFILLVPEHFTFPHFFPFRNTASFRAQCSDPKLAAPDAIAVAPGAPVIPSNRDLQIPAPANCLTYLLTSPTTNCNPQTVMLMMMHAPPLSLSLSPACCSVHFASVNLSQNLLQPKRRNCSRVHCCCC